MVPARPIDFQTISRRVAPFLGGLLLCAAALWLYNVILSPEAPWPGPVTAPDLTQVRINRTLPPPQEGSQIRQKFVPTRDGLYQVTARAVSAGSATGPAEPITLTLVDDQDQILAERSLNPPDFTTPRDVTLTFAPQPHARGRPYYLILSGSRDNTLSLQGYSLNVIIDGRLAGEGLDDSQALYLQSRYQLQWSSAVIDAFRRIYGWLPVLLAAIALIPLPGALLLLWFLPRWPRLVRWGVAWAIGIAGWPFLWLLLTWFNGRWTTWTLTLAVVGGWLIWFIWRRRLPPTAAGARPEGDRLESAAFVLFCAAVFVLRVIAVRDTVALPWVDASRHALITAVMRESGQFLTSYRPYLPVDFAPYHYGLHTLTAGVGLLQPAAELPELLLAIMQLLSTLLCLAVYSGSWLLTGRRSASWMSAFLIGVPFFFPAYYTTWGRLTQIAGLTILAILLGFTWRYAWSSRISRQITLTLLAAGLFFVHARVFLLFVPFWGLVYLRRLPRLRRPRAWMAALSLLGVGLLGGPRYLAIQRSYPALIAIRRVEPGSTVTAFPTGYLTTGWETPFWLLTGVLILLLLLQWLWRRPLTPTVHAALLLALWIGTLGLLVGGPHIHPRWPVWLPQVSLNSAYISLFVPQAMVMAGAGVWLSQWLRRRHALAERALAFFFGGVMLIVSWFGIHHQAGILNDGTLLMQPTDLDAIGWIDQHAPADARIGQHGWLWLNNVWAATDGGGWILPLTGRVSLAPPIDHIYSPDLQARTVAFHRAADEINDWSSEKAQHLLNSFAVTHLFVGVRSGSLDPAELADHPAWEIVFHHGGTFVFAKAPPNASTGPLSAPQPIAFSR